MCFFESNFFFLICNIKDLRKKCSTKYNNHDQKQKKNQNQDQNDLKPIRLNWRFQLVLGIIFLGS